MKKWWKSLTVAVALFGLAAGARAQEVDPLLQLLIENKVITKEQAAAVQAEYDKNKAGAKEEIKQAAQEEVAKAKPNLGDLGGVKIGGRIYYSFQNGESFNATSPSQDKTDAYNKFVLKRAYIEISKDITPWMKAQITPDIYQDATGNYNFRVKYAYGLFHWNGNSFVAKPEIEAGIAHTPWLDFEEGINAYRCQDTMFMERVGIITSADAGVLFTGQFGGELPKSYQDDVAKKNPGRYGSFAMGYYNGGGYSSAEANTNKTFQMRATYRPLPDYVPGLQVSGFWVKGRGNTAPKKFDKDPFNRREIYPDYEVLAGMLSYQHEYFTLTAQTFEARGNQGGSRYYNAGDYVPGKVDPRYVFQSTYQKGYSFFGEAKFPSSKRWSLIARYDHYDPDTKGIYDVSHKYDEQNRFIGGVAYKLFKENMLLLDYDQLSHDGVYKDAKTGLYVGIPTEKRVQLTLQLKW
jgi:hypothetical protein